MGGITSTTRRAELTAMNFCYDDDLIPKTAEGCNVAAKKVHGSHVFEISGYSLHRELPDGDLGRAMSAVFTVGGFDWVIVVLTGGLQGCVKKFPALGAFLQLMSEDEGTRVRASFHISLVDVTGSAPPYTMVGTNEFDPEPERSGCSGRLDFKLKSELEASPYLREDRLTIECGITVECVITAVDKDVKSFAELPPSDITVFTEHTDVIFEVEGEDFPAHRRVLAMRSPVFKAELYGEMRENDIDRITIADIQPAVFEALLNFVYTDSLPAVEDLGRTDYVETIRHLLFAADRYAIDTLKSICEGILSENIDVKTVLATLALADQHHCDVLNEACLQFIASLDRVHIEVLIASQEYAELKANCPLALVELWEKICSLGSRSKSSFHFGCSLA
ncbi:hypothetical protein ACQ4PT_017983 [Festuca glaucescens]